MKENTIEQRKSVKEGGLETGIKKIRDRIETFISIVDQIESLQKVPHGYKEIGDKVDNSHLPALDQFVEYRGTYDSLQNKTEESLNLVYQNLMTQLSMLRDHTGISTQEETMKFNKDTGRQEKDN